MGAAIGVWTGYTSANLRRFFRRCNDPGDVRRIAGIGLNPEWSQRDNWLPNRIFKSYEDVVDHCRFAWNKLVEQP